MSTPLPVISGVPQGSVLGPLLFDLPDCLSSPVKAKIFVDDTKIYFIILLVIHPFVSSLSAFCDWASNWQLSIALQKCNVISFGRQIAPDTSYSLCGVTLEHVSYLHDLGVYVSSDLKPGILCSSIATKVYSRSSLLLRGFQTD